MARLFITPREIDFINDISKEVAKDVVGQKIYYYSVSLEKSRVHDLYDEAIEKVFDNPVEINAFVDWQESEVKMGAFGSENLRTIEVYISSRDLIQRNLSISEGDFISYGTQFFEIVRATGTRSIYGQIEYTDGIRLLCREARASLFASRVLGPKGEEYSDDDAVQKEFHQQRGFAENPEGPTGDVRDLQRRGVLDEPLEGTREVSEQGDDKGTSSFYGD